MAGGHQAKAMPAEILTDPRFARLQALEAKAEHAYNAAVAAKYDTATLRELAAIVERLGKLRQTREADLRASEATAANAAKIAGYLGAAASASTSLPAGHVEVLLGTSVTAMPAGLGSSGAAGAAGAGAPTATATSAGDNGAAAGTVTVNSKTPYGVPCVY